MSNFWFSWNRYRILWAFTWSNQSFSNLAPFSLKSHFLRGGWILVLFVYFWGLRTRNPKICLFSQFYECQMLWNGKKHQKHQRTTDIGRYKLCLKGKYEEIGEFNTSYHASLSYLHEKRISSVREVLNLNILSYFVLKRVRTAF